MIKNQIAKPNNIKCSSSVLLNFNKYNSAKTTLKRNNNKPSPPNWDGNTGKETYSWDAIGFEDVRIDGWDSANSDPSAVAAANENLQDKESLGKRFKRIARGLGKAAKTLFSKFGSNSPNTEASPQYTDEWSGSGGYTPPTDTWDTGGYNTGADSFGGTYDFDEASSPVVETSGSKLRSPAILSGLGGAAKSLFDRAKNISPSTQTMVESQPTSSWDSDYSGLGTETGTEYGGYTLERSSALKAFIKKIGEILKKPETMQLAKKVGMIALEESGVTEGGEFSYVGSATLAAKAVANPWGTAAIVGAKTAKGAYAETSDMRGDLMGTAWGSVRGVAEARGFGGYVPDTMPTSTGDVLDHVQEKIQQRSKLGGLAARTARRAFLKN